MSALLGTRCQGPGTRSGIPCIGVPKSPECMLSMSPHADRKVQGSSRSPVPGPRSHGAPVLILAGGTGGHIFPGLAVAEVLAARGIAVSWMGAAGAMEEKLVRQHGIALDTIAVGGLRGKSWLVRLTAPWMLLRALVQAWRVLRRVRPRSVLSMGGFAAGPGGLVAWLQRKPLLVHEQNSVAGLTNRLLARVARRVLSGFPETFASHPQHEWVGNPVRARISAVAPPAERLAGRDGPMRLLVLGGSLGARSLNLGVPQALAAMAPEARPLVWHQAGQRGLAEALDAYADFGVDARIDAFVEDMAQAYAWADLCVCRAGALTIAELCAAGLGALFVPYPHAVDDHQSGNARVMRDAGAAEIVAEADIAEGILARRLHALLHEREKLQRMAAAARELARPRAAERIAQCCIEEGA